MPFVIARTRASGAGITVDGPHNLLKHLKSCCQLKEGHGYKPFKFSWLHSCDSYRGGIEGKLENTNMSVRKVLNTIEACGWRLLSAHNHGECGSEYLFTVSNEQVQQQQQQQQQHVLKEELRKQINDLEKTPSISVPHNNNNVNNVSNSNINNNINSNNNNINNNNSINKTTTNNTGQNSNYNNSNGVKRVSKSYSVTIPQEKGKKGSDHLRSYSCSPPSAHSTKYLESTHLIIEQSVSHSQLNQSSHPKEKKQRRRVSHNNAYSTSFTSLKTIPNSEESLQEAQSE